MFSYGFQLKGSLMVIARWPIARQKAVDPRVEITNKNEYWIIVKRNSGTIYSGKKTCILLLARVAPIKIWW